MNLQTIYYQPNLFICLENKAESTTMNADNLSDKDKNQIDTEVQAYIRKVTSNLGDTYAAIFLKMAPGEYWYKMGAPADMPKRSVQEAYYRLQAIDWGDAKTTRLTTVWGPIVNKEDAKKADLSFKQLAALYAIEKKKMAEDNRALEARKQQRQETLKKKRLDREERQRAEETRYQQELLYGYE